MMNTIRKKITATYILITLLVILLIGILSSHEIERYFIDRLTADISSDIQSLELSLNSLDNNQVPGTQRLIYLRSYASLKEVRVTIIDSTGRVQFDSAMPDSALAALENHGTRPEVIEARLRSYGSDIRLSKSVNQEFLYVARVVNSRFSLQAGDSRPAYLRISVSLADIQNMLYEIRFKLIIVSLVVLIVIIIVSRVIGRTISQPINEITDLVKEIQSGNYDQKLPVKSNDELGQLAKMVNQMAETIKSDIEQLRKLERVRTEFLGNVSHELRTPIFSLKGFLETLLDGAIDDRDVNRKFLKKAYHHAARLDALLSDLIEISRIEWGDMKMSFRYFDLIPFLRQVAEEYSEETSKKNQRICLVIPVETLVVLADKERLEIAIGNLIDNAIKYTPPASTITLSVTQSETLATLTVADDGPGIESEHLPRIFERFYRIDKNRSREVGGTGLGLAIVKHIIEAHNSRITVSSVLGQGTTFSFSLKK